MAEVVAFREPISSSRAFPGVDPVEGLGRFKAFCTLDRGILGRMARLGQVRSVAAETTLYEQGAAPTEVHVLLSGLACLVAASRSGPPTIVEVVKPVDCMGLAAALAEEPYLTAARTLADAAVLVLPTAGFRALVAESPNLASAALIAVSAHYRAMVRHVKDLKLRTVPQRLACYLLELSEEVGDSDQFRLPIGKALLAARLGSTPEHLSRAFGALRACQVETHGSRVILHDRAALVRFAQAEPADAEIA